MDAFNNRACALGNIGLCLIGKCAFEEAINIFDLQIFNLVHSNDSENLANALGNKSLALHFLKRFPEAIEILSESLVILEKSKLFSLVAERSLRMAVYLMKIEDFETALNFLRSTLQYSTNPSYLNNDIACKALQALGICHYTQGKITEAEKYFESSNQYSENNSSSYKSLDYIVNCLFVARSKYKQQKYKTVILDCRKILGYFESIR